MTYYRLALQNKQTAMWAWKSTVLTSLHAVFQLLRIYRVLPQDRIRVFSSMCKEDLTQTLLNCEKNRLAVYSVTAAEFSQARKLQMYEVTLGAYDRETPETIVQPLIAIALASSQPVSSGAMSSPGAGGFNVLEKKRLESEMGPGGDHDLPYTFMLPVSLSQTRSWIHLSAKVRRGELQP